MRVTGIRSPERQFAVNPVVISYLIDWAGTGLLLTVLPVYFTGSHLLSVAQYAVALSVASASGFLISTPIGRLADRYGVRTVLVGLYTWRAIAVLSLLFAHSMFGVMVSLILMTVADRPSGPLLQALVGVSSVAEDRVRTMAAARTAANVGIAFGSLLGAGLLVGGGDRPLRGAVGVDCVSFVVVGILIAVRTGTGRSLRPVRKAKPSGRAALRDRRFLVLTGLNGVLGLHKSLLLTAIPLWLTTRTQVPHYWVGLLIVFNTVLVVALQIPLSRGADTLTGAARALVLGGFSMALACGSMIVATNPSRDVAICAILVATGFVTLSEILQSAGAWSVSFAYAPAERRGEYLVVFNLGNGARDVVGPPLFTVGVFPAGFVGWVAVAGLVSGAGLLLSRTVARDLAMAQVPVEATAAQKS